MAGARLEPAVLQYRLLEQVHVGARATAMAMGPYMLPNGL